MFFGDAKRLLDVLNGAIIMIWARVLSGVLEAVAKERRIDDREDG